MIKVTVQITIQNSLIGTSMSSHKDIYEAEDGSLERLAQSIVYAIPKQDFPPFDVIEIFSNGKAVGHGEHG